MVAAACRWLISQAPSHDEGRSPAKMNRPSEMSSTGARMAFPAADCKGEGVPLFDLPPADHVRMLHPAGRRGSATVARVQAERWNERVVRLDDLPFYAEGLRGEPDAYVSQQSFWGWRRIAKLAQLGACYVDLDYHRTQQWSDRSPDVVTTAALVELRDRGLPAPSYILATGRGLLCVWLHDLVPRQALPRWQAIQRHLADALESFGADRKALDAARVFRIAGTTNSRSSGAEVRPTYVGHLVRWDFEDLAREALPMERSELVVLGAERARRRAERRDRQAARREPGQPTRTLTGATYWETVLTDLQRLRELRWFGGLPHGQRDCWLFLACNAMSWLAPPAAMQRELYALAQEVGGWTSRECDARMSAVFSRARMAAAGQTIEWMGQRVDPRYRFRASTICEWLEIEPAEMREAGLRVLIDRSVKNERNRERWCAQDRAQEQRERRRQRGSSERALYEAEAHERAENILKLLRRVGTVREVAQVLGVPYETAKKRVQRARAR